MHSSFTPAMLAFLFLAITQPAWAQLGGENIRGDFGLKSGSQGPPSRPERRPPVRRITLEEAQEQAETANKSMVRLGELQIEVAKQHRLATQSDYFPKVNSSFFNFHFNKFMGDVITVQRPLRGGTTSIGLPLAGKDQTLVTATVAQPITPLFKVRQAVNLAQADEEIAKAKAGQPAEAASNIEENYYRLLVEQRHLAIAKANADKLENRLLVAGNSLRPVSASEEPDELLEAANAIAQAEVKVKELTASFNQLLGWPLDTELELAPPALEWESISLQQATDKAMLTNAEVVEAEQNVAKARAASTLSKLEYVPDVALLGGYVYNSNAVPLLPRDFSFIGVMGSYNVYDFGKREHSLKERKAQVEMAELAAQLTKAKVAAGVKHSYLEVERSRQLSEMRHRMASAIQLRKAAYGQEARDFTTVRASAEAKMFEADLAYRQAFRRLKAVMGVQ